MFTLFLFGFSQMKREKEKENWDKILDTNSLFGMRFQEACKRVRKWDREAREANEECVDEQPTSVGNWGPISLGPIWETVKCITQLYHWEFMKLADLSHHLSFFVDWGSFQGQTLWFIWPYDASRLLTTSRDNSRAIKSGYHHTGNCEQMASWVGEEDMSRALMLSLCPLTQEIHAAAIYSSVMSLKVSRWMLVEFLNVFVMFTCILHNKSVDFCLILSSIKKLFLLTINSNFYWNCGLLNNLFYKPIAIITTHPAIMWCLIIWSNE